VALWQRHVAYLDEFLAKNDYAGEARRLNLADRRRHAASALNHVQSAAYLEALMGTLGADPL
jgi:hypothetical protein